MNKSWGRNLDCQSKKPGAYTIPPQWVDSNQYLLLAESRSPTLITYYSTVHFLTVVWASLFVITTLAALWTLFKVKNFHIHSLVPETGFEPARLKWAPGPKPGEYTNSSTLAKLFYGGKTHLHFPHSSPQRSQYETKIVRLQKHSSQAFPQYLQVPTVSKSFMSFAPLILVPN